MYKVLDNGRISYNENLNEQFARAEETWNKYDIIEYSSRTMDIIQERKRERDSLNEKISREETLR